MLPVIAVYVPLAGFVWAWTGDMTRALRVHSSWVENALAYFARPDANVVDFTCAQARTRTMHAHCIRNTHLPALPSSTQDATVWIGHEANPAILIYALL